MFQTGIKIGLRYGFRQPLFNNSINCCRQISRIGRLHARQYGNYRRFDNSIGRGRIGFDWSRLVTDRRTGYLVAGFAAFYVYNLHEAPFTHRKRFIWAPYWLERKIGDYSYQQLMYQYQNQIVPSNNPIYYQISTIMNKLLQVAMDGLTDTRQKEYMQSLDWKIHVIQVDKSQPPNAFILPNGKIFIFSSILPICKNDDGLATVLSHELSHQLAHHSGEQISKSPFYLMLSVILYSITGTSQLNDLLISGLLQLPASREMESEADHIGCELLAKSCFNLQEAINFWNRMADQEIKLSGQAGGGAALQLQEFFSTHPATSKRIHDIESWMPALRQLKENAGCYDHHLGSFRDSTKSFFRL